MSSPIILSPPPAPPPRPARPQRREVDLRAKAFRWLRAAGMGSRHVLGGLHVGRRSVDSVVFGCLLTLLVIAADSAGWLAPVEHLIYDARARAFQFFLPPPTDKLVHLDIDEGTLEAISATEKKSFPWPRSILAEILDEVAIARPRVVGLDIIFPETNDPLYQPQGDLPPAARAVHGTVVQGSFKVVDHDAALATSLKRMGRALVPVSLPFERRPRPTPFDEALRAELERDLAATQAQLTQRLRARQVGDDKEGDSRLNDVSARVAHRYMSAWRAAAATAVRRELRSTGTGPATAPQTRAAIRGKLLKLDRADSLLESTFDDVYNGAVSEAYMARFALPIPPGLPALFDAELKHLPVPPIAAAAAYTGSVTFPRFSDGRVRAIPLFVKHDDRMYPQMGLAMACAQLGVDLSALRLGPETLTIPAPPGSGRRDVVIPHRIIRSETLGADVPTFMDIPWWGRAEWAAMYDHPRHRRPVNHVPVVAVWDLVLARRKLGVNARAADAALISMLDVLDQTAAEAYVARRPPADDFAARQAVYQANSAAAKETAEFVRSVPESELDERSRRFLAAMDSLPGLLAESGILDRRLRDGRAEMRKQVEGRSVFVGWTFTGVAADFVPTSIHAQCPGVVLHGAIFNAIMTGELWRTLPGWMTYLTTAFLGLCMSIVTAFVTPARALAIAVALGVGYALFNGLLLFDYANLVLGAAGPLICIAGVWQGCTLVRLIVERYQRSRIEGRFRSYVDPALVDYVVRNPDQIKLEGQVREMTVCFTDLGNFTPLTAQLKEATIPLLNRLFGSMVPEIRKNSGYVNKFLGDGIMFFFGAPRANPHHARDALRAILDIQRALSTINAELVAEGLPTIALRAGVNTGSMVVGDAGSDQASDYTVLGDSVNLAARLESANKQLGTWSLVSARTVELAGLEDDWLLRPVGQICVVGRDEPVVAFEVLGRRAEASEEQRRLADRSTEMVAALREARLADCLRAADELDAEFGPSKLTARYRERASHFLAQGDSAEFDCTITLAQK